MPIPTTKTTEILQHIDHTITTCMTLYQEARDHEAKENFEKAFQSYQQVASLAKIFDTFIDQNLTQDKFKAAVGALNFPLANEPAEREKRQEQLTREFKTLHTTVDTISQDEKLTDEKLKNLIKAQKEITNFSLLRLPAAFLILSQGQKKFFDYMQQFAKFNIPEAHLSLSFLHSIGFGCPPSAELSLQSLESAANLGNTIALNNLGVIYREQGRQKEAFECFRQGKDNGKAQFNTAEMLFDGEGVPKNEEEAMLLYEKSANAGNLRAQIKLSEIHEKGTSTIKKNAEDAFKYRMQAAKQGHADSQYHVAYCLKFGIGTEPNPIDSVAWSEKAALGGNLNAQLTAVKVYTEGMGPIKPDPKKAFKYNMLAALQHKYPTAQHNVGLAFLNGWGTPPNIKQAIDWLDKAAFNEKGKPNDRIDAMSMLSNLFHQKRNYKIASQYYLILGMLGYPAPLFNLAVYAEQGINTLNNKPDLKLADELFHKAAIAGGLKAQIKLGDKHDRAHNYNKAAFYYGLTVRHHKDAESQYNIGCYYDKGYITPDNKPDFKKGFVWKSKAANQGFVPAQVYMVRANAVGIPGVVERNLEASYRWNQKIASSTNTRFAAEIQHAKRVLTMMGGLSPEVSTNESTSDKKMKSRRPR